MQRFEEAGLDVQMDAAGNLIGKRMGRVPGLASIMVGSHIDTVPSGGRFDGTAGVLAALEVVRTLTDHNISLRHPLEVVDFLAEEPSRHGLSCIGSRALAGVLSKEMLRQTDPNGETVADGIQSIGGNPGKLGNPIRSRKDVAGFFELHIEQGPVLISENIPIGIVTDVVGITRVSLRVDGQSAHAGTTPMNLRRDALVGASSIVSFIAEHAVRELDGPDYLVATVGKLDVYPNGSNVVPGKVVMTFEVRCGSDDVRRRFINEIMHYCDRIRAKGQLDIISEVISDSPAMYCSTEIVNALISACKSRGVDFRTMSSGAGHDTVHMARIAPAGLIFIPCHEGKSHCPEEWAEPEHVWIGANVLLSAIMNHDLKS
jgi:N-carbamoyl-L-amino-acid hydrolase